MAKKNFLSLGGRQTGKTHDLIVTSNATGKYIVCRDRQHAHYIAQKAEKMGMNIPFPITYAELPIVNGSFIEDVLVDDLVSLAEYFIKRPIVGATIDTELFNVVEKAPYHEGEEFNPQEGI